MAQPKSERRGLGRGLSALMADVDVAPGRSEPARKQKSESLIAIDRIEPNPDQPRRTFTEDALKELAASLAEKGRRGTSLARGATGQAARSARDHSRSG